MATISIVSAEKLDYDEYVDLQKDAYSGHLKKYSISTNFINRELFEWKYSAPSGFAKMAVAYEGKSIVAAVAAIPLMVGNNRNRTLLWRAVDIATRPAGRGKGLFTKLLNALIGDMSDGEIFAAFPNSNSMPGFKRVGCYESQSAATWVRPIIPGRRTYDTATRIERVANEDSDLLRQLLIREGENSFIRDVDYLNWRYADHPSHKYHIHYLRRDSGESGFIVFRVSEIYRRRMLLILEMWSSNNSIWSDLMKIATQYGRHKNLYNMLTVNSSMTGFNGFRHGFLAVPRSLVPKQQVLCGATRGETASRMLRDSWAIQMGDLLEF